MIKSAHSEVVTIWSDGSWKVWRQLDAAYADGDKNPDFVCNISIQEIEAARAQPEQTDDPAPHDAQRMTDEQLDAPFLPNWANYRQGVADGANMDSTNAAIEVVIYKAALEYIANPIAAMQAECRATGNQLNGAMAVQISRDSHHLQSKAQDALAAAIRALKGDKHD